MGSYGFQCDFMRVSIFFLEGVVGLFKTRFVVGVGGLGFLLKVFGALVSVLGNLII